MTTYDCDTCKDTGRVDWMIEADPNCYIESDSEGKIPCPDCQHDIETCEDDHEERWDWRYDTRLGRRWRRFCRRISDLRILWRDRHAETIGAMVTAHRPILDDEPRLRALLENDLHEALREATPLDWRIEDFRRHWRNARRALRALEPLPPSYEERTTVQVSAENHDLFDRNMVAIIGERRRVR